MDGSFDCFVVGDAEWRVKELVVQEAMLCMIGLEEKIASFEGL
jgi:hypothetical protein